MDNQRQSEFLGQTDVTIKKISLDIPARSITKPVEASLTDCCHPPRDNQSGNPVPLIWLNLCHIIGMDASCTDQSRFRRTEVRRRLTVGCPGANHCHPGDARGPSAGKHIFKVSAVAEWIEMAVAVVKVHRPAVGTLHPVGIEPAAVAFWASLARC